MVKAGPSAAKLASHREASRPARLHAVLPEEPSTPSHSLGRLASCSTTRSGDTHSARRASGSWPDAPGTGRPIKSRAHSATRCEERAVPSPPLGDDLERGAGACCRAFSSCLPDSVGWEGTSDPASPCRVARPGDDPGRGLDDRPASFPGSGRGCPLRVRPAPRRDRPTARWPGRQRPDLLDGAG